jgi:Ca2+-transporting ATPase
VLINATAFEGVVDGQQTFIGSQTETALLSFARTHLSMGPVNIERSNVTTVHIIPFDATRQSMGVIVALGTGHYRLYVKGASEVILRKCTRVTQDPRQGFSDIEINAASREYLHQTISDYALRSLRTIGLAYRDFDRWPLAGDSDPGSVPDVSFEDLVFFGVTGIQEPLRIGARDAVQVCQKAGVVVRMVSREQLKT